jgi:hypothetical protein
LNVDRYGRKVVVLIDEYDKPLLQTMEDTQPQEEIRKGPYTAGSRKLVKVGVQFDAATRTIGRWKALVQDKK